MGKQRKVIKFPRSSFKKIYFLIIVGDHLLLLLIKEIKIYKRWDLLTRKRSINIDCHSVMWSSNINILTQVIRSIFPSKWFFMNECENVRELKHWRETFPFYSLAHFHFEHQLFFLFLTNCLNEFIHIFISLI